MQVAKLKLAAWFLAGLAAGLCAVGVPHFARAGGRDRSAERLQKLEAREEIEELFTAYGATLDRHDFDAFGKLFAEDAVYGGGAGEPARGRAAIRALLEKQITGNPTPDFHLFFNPSIHVEGDRATAQSKGAYVIPDTRTNGAQIIFLVSYEDVFVRRGGHWLFQQRILRSGIPAPPSR
jgi:uncharacterized protein (TIGR02246 family)